ncbi:MAG TPA: excinuclease ABC subunit A [Bacteroidetes bacterium]|nr:excinuclease ABC subunit A [Bacteroidota bacterium]
MKLANTKKVRTGIKKVKEKIHGNGYEVIYDPKKFIIIKGARVHNLKSVDINIPKYKLVVFTGVSGSGKSSLVFDTIYAEGQRRYVESLSSYARQFLERMNKPDVDFISGLAPSMAIEQKTQIKTSRSTVGTTTEIYDYLRLLFARIGRTYSPVSGIEVKKDSPESIIKELAESGKTFPKKIYVMTDAEVSNLSELKHRITDLKSKGFYRIITENEITDLNDIDEKKFLKEYYADADTEEKKTLRVLADRLMFDPADNESVSRLNDSIELAYRESGGFVIIREYEGDNYTDLRYNKFFEADGIKFEEPQPRLFSFNNPYGACGKCQGFSRTMDVDMDLVISDKKLSVFGGVINIFNTPKHSKHLTDLITEADDYGLDFHTPYNKLSEESKKFIYEGGKKYIGLKKFFRMIEKEASYKLHYRVLLNRYRAFTTCSECGGARLRKEALYIKISGKTIFDIVKMKISEAYEFFKNIKLNEYESRISERIMEEIVSRLKYLNDVGLTYLTLDRLSNTLSGGESQRINLSTSLGSSLVGSIYVLDEPSIGLHPRDNQKLIDIMKSLRDIGNSVLVVEHDSDMMKEADEIVDMGPFAGEKGGEKIFQGTYNEIIKSKDSLTGKYLSGSMKINIPKTRRPVTEKSEMIVIKGARENNLKDINVKIPLGMFVCVTGVSGSGKSTLINNILFGDLKRKIEGSYNEKIGDHDSVTGHKYLNALEMIDQNPIGKTSRSNPVTYIKAFDPIREAFAGTTQAMKKNLYSGHFSFNVSGGRCENCEGTGVINIEMQFMADIVLECEECKGKRYRDEILEIKLKGNDGVRKNISEVLDMTVSEAVMFFKAFPKIEKKLKVLEDVGLGYIRVGQSATTLSGGESQRVKLAYHLTFQEKGKKTLFIFDEPTTGLHYYDVSKLLKCFEELIKKGNSVVVIEHNLEVIKCADHIIDLGPESGDEGGYLVAQGTPEEVSEVKNSYTGKFLKNVLKRTKAV